MSDNQLSKVTAGKNGFIQQVNQFVDALAVNLLPRTIAGSVVDLAGTLGESTRRWSNVFTKSLNIKGETNEIAVSEDINEDYQIMNGAVKMGMLRDNSMATKTRGQIVSDNCEFINGDILEYSQAMTGGDSYTRNIVCANYTIFALRVTSGSSTTTTSVTNATQIARLNTEVTDDYLYIYISNSDSDKIINIGVPIGTYTVGVKAFAIN